MGDQLFRIPPGGDGDQNLLGETLTLRKVQAEWFHDEIPEFGFAMLFVVTEGKFAGEFIALTSIQLLDWMSRFQNTDGQA